MNIASLRRIAWAACILPLLLPGCASALKLKDTRQFYNTTSDRYRRPKPDDYPMPLLLRPPKHKYQVIGNFTMRSKQQGFNFMARAAQYNARLAGGDAVLVLEKWQFPYTYIYYPNETSTTTEVTDPQSKADRLAGKPQTTHTETTTDWGDPATGTGLTHYFDSEIIVYK